MGQFNADDIVALALAFIGPAKQPVRITGDLLLVHKAIFELREKYPLLQEFAFFQDSVAGPSSPLLERVLRRLEAAMVLKPWGNGYLVAKQVIKKRAQRRFNKEELAELRKIARELKSRILAVEGQ